MKREDKDRSVAAMLTFIAALAILLVLFKGGMTWDRSLLAQASTPETAPEETFIMPELMELGEETSIPSKAEAAPSLKGEPEKAEEERAEIAEPAPEPKTPPKRVQKEVAQKKESTVKRADPPATERERQKATTSVAGKFAPQNGTPDGSDKGTSGAGASGTGVSGNARGRTFISCPKPGVELRHKTVVTVNVVIDGEGRVIEATASGSADAAIRRKCEAAARLARWSEKKGTPRTRGSITFTIIPKY